MLDRWRDRAKQRARLQGTCFSTVSKLYQNPFSSSHWGCPSSEEQIPQIVGKTEKTRNGMDGLEGSFTRPREPDGFQRLHRFSLTTNDSNQPGKLLSLQSQFPRMEQMGFGHSSGTVKKQGREPGS